MGTYALEPLCLKIDLAEDFFLKRNVQNFHRRGRDI